MAFATAIVLDRFSKWIVLRTLIGRSVRVGYGPVWIRLRAVRNPVLGLGLLRGSGRGLLMALWGLATLSIVLLALTRFADAPATQAALGTACGGVAANVLDHLREGAVLDFIDLRFWPVFNVADIAIVVGATAALVGLLAAG